jgi:hypothetical protein
MFRTLSFDAAWVCIAGKDNGFIGQSQSYGSCKSIHGVNEMYSRRE